MMVFLGIFPGVREGVGKRRRLNKDAVSSKRPQAEVSQCAGNVGYGGVYTPHPEMLVRGLWGLRVVTSQTLP